MLTNMQVSPTSLGPLLMAPTWIPCHFYVASPPPSVSSPHQQPILVKRPWPSASWP